MAVDAFVDQLIESADPGGDKGEGCRHRFQKRHGQRLHIGGGENGEVEPRQDFGDVAALAKENDVPSEVESRNLTLQVGAKRTISHNNEACLGKFVENKACREEKRLVIFFGAKAGDDSGDRIARLDAPFRTRLAARLGKGETTEVDAIANEDQFVLRDPLGLQEILSLRRRHIDVTGRPGFEELIEPVSTGRHVALPGGVLGEKADLDPRGQPREAQHHSGGKAVGKADADPFLAQQMNQPRAEPEVHSRGAGEKMHGDPGALEVVGHRAERVLAGGEGAVLGSIEVQEKAGDLGFRPPQAETGQESENGDGAFRESCDQALPAPRRTPCVAFVGHVGFGCRPTLSRTTPFSRGGLMNRWFDRAALSRLAGIFVLLVASASLGEARTIRVPQDARSLTRALAVARDHDTIEVAAGVYSGSTSGEKFPLVLHGRHLTIRGADPWTTTIDAAGASRVFECAWGDSSLLENLTLVRGRTNAWGGGVLIQEASTRLRRIIFRECVSETGGDAVAFVRSRGCLSHSIAVGNEGTGPCVILEEGEPRVEWCTFHDNPGPGVLARRSSAVLEYNVFSSPGAPRGLVIGVVLEEEKSETPVILHQNYFLNCTQGHVQPARPDVHGDVGLQLADPGAFDYRLSDAQGEPLASQDAGAFGGELALLVPERLAQRVPGEPEPSAVELEGAVPNPFAPTTSIQYTVLEATVVDLGVYNVLGQRIRGLFAGDRVPGQYQETWDGRDDVGQEMPPGVYYVRVTQGHQTETQPLVLVR